MAKFQFTHPGKGATYSCRQISEEVKFQFTHPGKGATRGWYKRPLRWFVSIHAPWEGCD